MSGEEVCGDIVATQLRKRKGSALMIMRERMAQLVCCGAMAAALSTIPSLLMFGYFALHRFGANGDSWLFHL